MSEIAKKAADWWKSKLANGDRGDAKLENGLAQLLAMTRDVADIGQTEALDKFAVVLSEKIDEALLSGRQVYLGVDYHPDRVLSDAATEACVKVPYMGWPFKTSMWVDQDKITVREGYGAPLTVLS